MIYTHALARPDNRVVSLLDRLPVSKESSFGAPHPSIPSPRVRGEGKQHFESSVAMEESVGKQEANVVEVDQIEATDRGGDLESGAKDGRGAHRNRLGNQTWMRIAGNAISAMISRVTRFGRVANSNSA